MQPQPVCMCMCTWLRHVMVRMVTGRRATASLASASVGTVCAGGGGRPRSPASSSDLPLEEARLRWLRSGESETSLPRIQVGEPSRAPSGRDGAVIDRVERGDGCRSATRAAAGGGCDAVGGGGAPLPPPPRPPRPPLPPRETVVAATVVRRVGSEGERWCEGGEGGGVGGGNDGGCDGDGDAAGPKSRTAA